MVVVELDSVASRWVRQETLPGVTLKTKEGGITFVPTFVIGRLANGVDFTRQLY
jgi:hypothetical protein